MKFLVTTRNKDSYYALAPEKRLQLMAEAYAYMDKHLKAGKCREMFVTADLKGNVSIWDVVSSEEATRFVIENPLCAFPDIETQPLIESDVAKKAITDYVNKLVKSKKK